MRLVRSTSGEAFELGERPVVIGASQSCDLQVPGAAPEHARVVAGRIEAIARCIVGGVPLESGEQRLLVARCTVEIGAACWFVDDELQHTNPSMPTIELALRLVDRVREGIPLEKTGLVVVQGAHVRRTLVVEEGHAYTIGRAPTSDLRLEDDDDVSRTHLHVAMNDGLVLVRDEGATQGTFLGDVRLEVGRQALWEPDKMLRVGDDTVLALVVSAPARERIEGYARTRRDPSNPKVDVPSSPSFLGIAKSVAEIAPLPPLGETPSLSGAQAKRPSIVVFGLVVGAAVLFASAVGFLIWIFLP